MIGETNVGKARQGKARKGKTTLFRWGPRIKGARKHKREESTSTTLNPGCLVRL